MKRATKRGQQSILESPLEVMRSTVQPKERRSPTDPPGHGHLLMPCCPITLSERLSGSSPSLHCPILPPSCLFHNTGAKVRHIFLLHVPWCCCKEHIRPLQGTGRATANKNKKCGELEGSEEEDAISIEPGIRE